MTPDQRSTQPKGKSERGATLKALRIVRDATDGPLGYAQTATMRTEMGMWGWTIGALLSRAADDGLVYSWYPPGRNHHLRFQITDAGRAVLDKANVS
jgi:hypothetical protein